MSFFALQQKILKSSGNLINISELISSPSRDWAEKDLRGDCPRWFFCDTVESC